MDGTRDGIGIRLLTRAIAGSFAVLTLVAPGASASATAAYVWGEESVSGAVWPVDPHPVMAPFDPPGCAYCAGHRGVDLGSPPLTQVRAATAGTITYAGNLASRGVVVVDDGTRRVTYEPVTGTLPRGVTVHAGDVIGVLELVGSHCFPDACLHLGLIEDADDAYLDPLTLFGASSPVRLLPLWSDEPGWSAMRHLLPFL